MASQTLAVLSLLAVTTHQWGPGAEHPTVRNISIQIAMTNL
jgi:hypothetical protein